MKKIITILCIVFLSYSYTTTTMQDPFLGTWEWQQGNQVFRVELIDDGNNGIDGHYTMLSLNAQGQETIIYKSNKDLGHGFMYGPVIYGGSNGTDRLSAGIIDNITPNPNNFPILEGSLTMKIISTANCIGCQTTATWKIKEKKEWRNEGDNRTISIPIDITLVKVQ